MGPLLERSTARVRGARPVLDRRDTDRLRPRRHAAAPRRPALSDPDRCDLFGDQRESRPGGGEGADRDARGEVGRGWVAAAAESGEDDDGEDGESGEGGGAGGEGGGERAGGVVGAYE